MPIPSLAESPAEGTAATALQGATATLLLTLAARAGSESVIAASVFSDPEARRVAAALPFDLSAGTRDAAFVRGVVLRAALIDRLAAEFFAAHPLGIGITLGAGLCTRRKRLGLRVAQGVGVDWLNVDLPDAIRLREQHVTPGEGERNLACSILDPAWLDAADLPAGRPVLVMLEGVCPYLPQAPLEAMLLHLAQRFERRGSANVVVLDYVHPVLAGMPVQVGGMHLPVVSGFEDSARIAAIHPSIRVVSEDHLYSQFSDSHRLFEAAFRAATGRWPYTVARFALGSPHDA
ncbi:class I SAM-dependent methyltransferase [Variovorax sp. OV700]|uniref:class I SAM-dependent methyltransferase n=1 Tax=Variovorax sp. OV700 TaxID=1882826 RepID=UPI0008899AA2|nr:class I SAM-dependent methyltransferase [Variovorax sp. OV700]SDH73576.1 O-Methyltransferase involved in polyketide biosynthesis [Variovorax sp. OV700]